MVDEEEDCKRCHTPMCTPFDLEPTDYCNLCAQDLVVELQEECSRLDKQAVEGIDMIIDEYEDVVCPAMQKRIDIADAALRKQVEENASLKLRDQEISSYASKWSDALQKIGCIVGLPIGDQISHAVLLVENLTAERDRLNIASESWRHHAVILEKENIKLKEETTTSVRRGWPGFCGVCGRATTHKYKGKDCCRGCEYLW